MVFCLLITTPGVNAQTTLPGTKAFTLDGDPAAGMVDAIHAFLLRETAASVGLRPASWMRDYRSPEAYERSIAANRERFRTIIGAVDRRLPVTALQLEGTTGSYNLSARHSRRRCLRDWRRVLTLRPSSHGVWRRTGVRFWSRCSSIEPIPGPASRA